MRMGSTLRSLRELLTVAFPSSIQPETLGSAMPLSTATPFALCDVAKRLSLLPRRTRRHCKSPVMAADSYPLLGDAKSPKISPEVLKSARIGRGGTGPVFYGSIADPPTSKPPPEAIPDAELGQGGSDSSSFGGSRGGGGDHDGEETPQNPLQWYMSLLDTRPVVTKCVTSGVISGLSDVIAQFTARVEELDWRRVAALTVVGAVLTAPLFHILYERLETVIPSGKGWRNVVLQLGIDQLIAAPVWLVAFFPLVMLIEDGVHRNTGRQLVAKYERDFWTSLLLTWKIFIPCQTLSFALLPASLRVLALNVVDLGYTAALSFISHASDEHVS